VPRHPLARHAPEAVAVAGPGARAAADAARRAVQRPRPRRPGAAGRRPARAGRGRRRRAPHRPPAGACRAPRAAPPRPRGRPAGRGGRAARRGSVRAAPARGATAPSAVAYLRRRTVGRAADAYRRWIGRAVGWWTVLYLLFWVVVFAVAGVESLAPLERRLPHPGGLFALAGLVALLAAGLGGRTPPVILDRRDLYRLGLGPQRPWHVLRWRWLVKQASGVAAALLLGGAWSLVAPAWFGVSAPYAAPALALLAWFLLGYRWLAYVGHPRQGPSAERRFAGGAFGVLTALTVMPLAGVATAQLLLGGASGPFADPLSLLDPLGGLTRATPLTLVVPALLALASHLCVRRTLAHDWPPRFAPQSLVLSQVQALRTF